MNLTALNSRISILDGPTGTELQKRGYRTSKELWTAEAALESPDVLSAVHREYAKAGAEILTANTFRTTRYSFEKAGRKSADAKKSAIASVKIAKKVTSDFRGCLVAGSLSPLEDCYHPERTPAEMTLRRDHAERSEWLLEGGADLALIETMGTSLEAKIALEEAKKAGFQFVAVSFIPEESGRKLLGGEELLASAEICLAAGADAILLNCAHFSILDESLRVLSPLAGQGVTLGAYANASLMHKHGSSHIIWDKDERTVEAQASEYAKLAEHWVRGFEIRLAGGCCGMTPAHVRELSKRLKASNA